MNPRSVDSGSARRPRTRRAVTAGALLAGLALAGCSSPSQPTGSTTTTTNRPTVPAATGQPAPGPAGSLSALACGDPATCWAVGTPSNGAATSSALVVSTFDGGSRWRSQSPAQAGQPALSAIACPDRRHCMAAGSLTAGSGTAGYVLVTVDGGRHWDQAATPPGAVDVVAVSCALAGHCLALVTNGTFLSVDTTATDGYTWQGLGTLPLGFSGATAMSCPDAQTCLVAGYMPAAQGHGTGAVARTDDGGQTWSLAAVPAGSGYLHDVGCSDPSDCLAVGTASTTVTDVAPGTSATYASSDGGATWQPVTAPTGVGDAFGVACHATGACVVVGTRWGPGSDPTPEPAAVTTTDAGTSWTDVRVRYAPYGLVAVACPPGTPCLAVGGGSVVQLNSVASGTATTTTTTTGKPQP